MKTIVTLILLVTTLSWGVTSVIEMEGTVDNGMAYQLNRGLDSMAEEDTVVLKINTYGGGLNTAFDMADSIFRSPAYIVAYVDQKAISAGALVAIACNEIVMSEGSTIGDCAPVLQSSEGPQIMNEKIQSPLRAKFRLFADRNGYPRSLAAAMVSKDMKIYRITTEDSVYYSDLIHDTPPVTGNADTVVMVDEGDLLTLTEAEALATGFASSVVPDFQTFSESWGIDQTTPRITRNWSERFVALIGAIAPILMMIGMAGLYIESRTPGVGFPGIIGVIALVLAYSGQHMAGLANYLEFLILAVGVALLLLEVFVIPGFGVAGIAGILCIAISAVFALQNFTIPSPELPFQQDVLIQNIGSIALAVVGATVMVVLFFIFVFPRLSRVVAGPVLQEHLQKFEEPLRSLVGQDAMVVKALHPSGKVQVAGIVYDAISEGLYLPVNTTVRVISSKNGTLQVRKMES